MGITIKKVDNLKLVEKTVEKIVRSHTKALSPESKIIIKPNICAPLLPDTGVTTHHEIIRGTLNALKDFDKVYIVESNSTSSDFDVNVKGWNIDYLPDYPNTKLINLSSEETSTKCIRGLEKEYNIEFAKLLDNYDYFIDLPVLKAHIHARISIGIKNLFGLLSVKNKSQYHIYIHDLLLGLLNEFNPDLTIVDGIQALEGQGPIFGTPTGAGILLAGENVVEVDYVASKIAGIDPFTVKYLNNAINMTDLCKKEIKLHGSIPLIKNFHTYPTLIYQLVSILNNKPGADENFILKDMEVPDQTKRNTPLLLKALCNKGMITYSEDNKGYKLADKEAFITLFPETEKILSR